MSELNPAWVLCFWCGQEQDFALLDEKDMRGKKNVQAVIKSYEPCEECKKYWDTSVNIVEINTEPLHEGQPPIFLNLYPTTRHINIAADLFDADEKREAGEIILVDPSEFNEWEERAIKLARKSDGIE